MATVELLTGDICANVDYTVSQNTGNNTSTVTINSFYLKSVGGYNNKCWIYGSITIDGSVGMNLYSPSSTRSNAVGFSDSWGLVCTSSNIWGENKAVTVTHAADGKKSITFRVIITAESTEGYEGRSLNTTKSVDLPTIARTSDFTIPASAKMGTSITVTITRASSSFTHRVYYTFGGKKNISISNSAGTTCTWAIPDLAAECNNATSGTCTILVETYNGSAKVGSKSKTMTLNVQDATTPSLSNVTCGSQATISCARNSSNFTVEISYTFSGTTAAIQSGKINSCTWTPSYELAKKIPTKTSENVTVTCVTKNGTATVGTKTKTVTLSVPDNATTKPKFDSDRLRLDVVSDLEGDLGAVYIRGFSGIRAAFDAQSEYSEIDSYSLSVGTQKASGNPATITTLQDEGTVSVTATVTDKRGYSSTVTTSVMILPYRTPRVSPYTGENDVICVRAKSTGEISSDGIYLLIKASMSFSSLISDGVELNSCVLRFRYKMSTVSGFGAWITLIAAGSAENQINTILSNVVPSTSTSYNIEISAVDAVGNESVSAFTIMTDAVSFHLFNGPDGAAFGKYAEEPHVVEIAPHMKLIVRGDMIVEGTIYAPDIQRNLP